MKAFMKTFTIAFVIFIAFPIATFSKQFLPKKPKSSRFTNIRKDTNYEFGTFKFVSPFLVKKNIFIG
ncbi:hypothetical protein EGI26_05950 [Lacihabitans sp. CCS-44]|nr:hypothetical protein [Lacihabitans sp. CCS-44]